MRIVKAVAILASLVFSAASVASSVSDARQALAVERLESADVEFGESVGNVTSNPYAAVYGASFFADSSTHYTRRLTVRDNVSGQFQVRCDNVPAGIIAYRSGGGGMVFSLSPDPNVIGGALRFWKIDPVTCGYTTLVPSSPFSAPVTGGSFDPAGRLWFAGPGRLYQVSTDTGLVLNAWDQTTGGGATSVAIAFDPSGAFYLIADAHLYRWPQAPAATPAPNPSSDMDLSAIAPAGSPFGLVAGLTYTDRAQLLVVSSQLDQGGQSSLFKAYDFAPLVGTLVNSGTTFGSNEGLFSASAYPAVANLVMSMTLGQTGRIDPGTQLPWTVTLRNDGPQAALNSAFTNYLPAHLRFVPWSEATGSNRNCSSPAGYGVAVTCAFSLASGQSVSYTLLTELDPAFLSGRESNYAEVTSAPFSTTSTAGNNSGRPGSGVSMEPDSSLVSFVVGPSSHLEATMVGTPYAIWQGDTVSYAVAVRNVGPSATSGVSVVNTLPNGLTAQAATGQGWTCTLSGARFDCAYAGSVGVNQTVMLTITATGTSPATYTNRCTATSNLLDPTPSDTCSAQTVVRALPTSAPSITTSINPDTSCPLQFVGNLALKEITYDLDTSASIGGIATFQYPPAVLVEGAELACYGQRGNESSKILMPACSYDQPGAGGTLSTNCPVSTPAGVAFCSWRAYVRSATAGSYPLTFGLRLFGQPDSVSTLPLRMPVTTPADYLFIAGFDARQRPDQPEQNCQFH